MRPNHNFRTRYAVNAYATSRPLWDTPIFESKSFVVVPTVGALVEGWLLVVPKEPALSFAKISPVLFFELQELLQEIVPVVTSCYGSISIFEHGPTASQNAVGCGVDYAHLHVVPTNCDLYDGARKIAPNLSWESVSSLADITQYADSKGGYWFLQQPFPGGICRIAESKDGIYPNQLFRRIIASHLGRPSAFDWKNDPCEAKIAATVKGLSGSLATA